MAMIRRYACASAETSASCPMASSSGSDQISAGITKMPYSIEIHIPMRVTRRTRVSLPCATALATIGSTAKANPDPTMNSTKKIENASVAAASACTSYQPSIRLSVSPMAICARWLPINGRPSTSSARACWRYVRGAVIGQA